jgi:hypothetical protein
MIMIYLVTTMRNSVSTWVLAMVNDLLVKSGGHYFGDVRSQFKMGWFVNQSGRTSKLNPLSAIHLLLTQAAGRSYALHTQLKPSLSIRILIRLGLIKPIYITRDPRDVARSINQHGNEVHAVQGSQEPAFEIVESMEEAIRLTAELVDTSRQWAKLPGILSTSYERLRQDPVSELTQLGEGIGLSLAREDIEKVVERYRPGSSPELEGKTDMATAGRWQNVLTSEQVEMCHRLFGPAIEEMGYKL